MPGEDKWKTPSEALKTKLKERYNLSADFVYGGEYSNGFERFKGTIERILIQLNENKATSKQVTGFYLDQVMDGNGNTVLASGFLKYLGVQYIKEMAGQPEQPEQPDLFNA